MNNNEKRANRGITLIALVITIIVLLILAGISIATLTGENGILSKATTAKEKTKQENGAEAITLAINEMMIEKKSQGEDLTIDYIGDHIHEKLKIDKDDVTKNGSPVESVDVLYNDYVYQIDNKFQVKVVCPIKGRVMLEASYELKGNKAIIYVTAKTEDEQGIKKIQLPNDEEKDDLNQKENSFLNFSIYTQCDGYGAHAVYIDFINTSGSCVKTLQYEWNHGSSCINPYGPYTGGYSTPLVPAGLYYIQVRARVTRGVYAGFVAANSYIDLIP